MWPGEQVYYEKGIGDGSEEAVCEFFDENILKCHWVDSVETEVDGEYYRTIDGSRPGVRLDRLVHIDGGGVVGVEIKRCGEKLSKAIVQIIDYTNCRFWSNRLKRLVYFPEDGWLATFPLGFCFGGISYSVLYQHRVATMDKKFIVMTGPNKVLARPEDVEFSIMPKKRVVGSR